MVFGSGRETAPRIQGACRADYIMPGSGIMLRQKALRGGTMPENFQRLNFAPYWQMTNDNLMELIDLFPDDKLDWTPAPGEWSARVIITHIILARHHGPIVPALDGAGMQEVVLDCRTRDGIKKQLRSSWEMVAAFLSDAEKLDAEHEPLTANAPEYNEPEVYDGHYVAYHRMAHDLHHRSTIIGHLNQLGISLDGHRVRPL
jgi:uncharacterized damage-inducible protein DinB